MRPSRHRLAVLALLLAQPVSAQIAAAPPQGSPATAAPKLTDEELARLTGKFLLPGGVEIALSITSDTVLNGLPVLRTVFTVDRSSTLAVYGRADGAAAMTTTGAAGASQTGQAAGAPMSPTGIAVAFDRHSGIQTITPTYSAAGQVGVTIGAPAVEMHTIHWKLLLNLKLCMWLHVYAFCLSFVHAIHLYHPD